ncbi:hypothetical protein ACVMB1_000340 [Bradyrhizobium sp. USDA 4504]
MALSRADSSTTARLSSRSSRQALSGISSFPFITSSPLSHSDTYTLTVPSIHPLHRTPKQDRRRRAFAILNEYSGVGPTERIGLTTISREALYDLVWTEPVRTIAQRMGVSDVWLKKCCAKADIPVPDRGYWAKLRADKKVIRQKLPPRSPGMATVVTIGTGPRSYPWPPNPEADLPHRGRLNPRSPNLSKLLLPESTSHSGRSVSCVTLDRPIV